MKKINIIIILLNLCLLVISTYLYLNNDKENIKAQMIASAIINDDINNLNIISKSIDINAYKQLNIQVLKFNNDESFINNFIIFQKTLVVLKQENKIEANLINFDTQEVVRTSDCLIIKNKCALSIKKVSEQ